MGSVVGFDGTAKWSKTGSDLIIYLSDATSYIHSWKLDFTAEALDNTDFTSIGWKSFMAGMKQWGGSMEAYINDAKPLPVSDVGATGTLRLYSHVSDALVKNTLYKGSAICTGIHPSVAVEGIETQTLDFQGTGVLVCSGA